MSDVSGTELSVQAWVRAGDDPPGPPVASKLRVSHNHPSSWRKRKPSGLWTSTWDKGASDWMRWCRAEEFRTDFRQVWLLQPETDARVYRIDGMPDLIELCKRWPGSSPLPDIRPGEMMVDWLAVEGEYDAVWLTERGQWETRLPPPPLPDLYGWDCESTCWFNLRFSEVRLLESPVSA